VNILLAVCGSISAYRCHDLVRQLAKNGHHVRVILTSGAKKFVVPQVFKYLGAQDVYEPQSDFEYPQPGNHSSQNVLHVELAKWSDQFVIAPLSANSLSRLVRGEASDLMSSVFLAWHSDKPILIFPAMNTHMLEHPFTKENFDTLKKIDSLKNVFIHPTDSGLLACGDEGDGKLPSVEKIYQSIVSFPREKSNKRILITAGASQAPLDPVRYVTNPSTGETGYQLAAEALSKGFQVTLLAGLQSTPKLDLFQGLPGFKLERLRTTEDFLERVTSLLPKNDILIASAALCDLTFQKQQSKIRKENLTNSLQSSTAPDVLHNAIQMKENQIIIGFAAETELDSKSIQKKYNRKPTDYLIATKVSMNEDGETEGFKNDSAYYHLYKKDQKIDEAHLAKSQLASWLFDRIENDQNNS